MITLDWSMFAMLNCRKAKGNSYTTLLCNEVVDLVKENWDRRTPGAGETDCTRKVLVPVPPKDFFCPATAKLVKGMPVQAEVVQRQDGESPYIQNFVTPEDAKKFGAEIKVPAEFVNIVCYSAEALLENGGSRTTDCDWEIVTILAQRGYRGEPMTPLTMARNFLEMPGGTKGVYSAEEFANSIWYWANHGVLIRNRTSD